MRPDLLTVHMEHGLPLLAGLNLGALMGAQGRLAQGDEAAISDVLGALGSAGELRTIRKLSAVVNASAEELLAAELDPKKLVAMEGAAALRPFGETFKDALGFFTAWAGSLGTLPDSSGIVETNLVPVQLADASRSVDS